MLLETEALRQSITRGDEHWEGLVAAAFHRLTRAEQKLAEHDAGVSEEWEDRNRTFHEALIAGCPSRWILHFQHILYQQSERYRRLSLFRQPIARDIHAEHQAIYDATLARDTTRATSILSEHILRTLDGIKHLPPDFFSKKKRRHVREVGESPASGLESRLEVKPKFIRHASAAPSNRAITT